LADVEKSAFYIIAQRSYISSNYPLVFQAYLSKSSATSNQRSVVDSVTSVLMTAFEAYDDWKSNASWLALVELTKDLPEHLRITTRLYPVNYDQVRKKLAEDLTGGHDIILHLGQAPGSSRICLEEIAINVAGRGSLRGEEFGTLIDDGPVAYRSTLPLGDWARHLRSERFPAEVSHHAGTYLCNATLYMTHHIAKVLGITVQATFIHLPLDVSQVIDSHAEQPFMAASTVANALRSLLSQIQAVV